MSIAVKSVFDLCNEATNALREKNTSPDSVESWIEMNEGWVGGGGKTKVKEAM